MPCHQQPASYQAQTAPAADSEENKKPDRIELADITDNSAVSIQLGYGLIEMVDEQTGGPPYQPHYRHSQTDLS